MEIVKRNKIAIAIQIQQKLKVYKRKYARMLNYVIKIRII